MHQHINACAYLLIAYNKNNHFSSRKRDLSIFKSNEQLNIILQHKTKITLTPTPSQHLSCAIQVNGVEGIFIVDTGASNSCLDELNAEKFLIRPAGEPIEMSGAGKEKLQATSSEECQLAYKGQPIGSLSFMLIDMIAVNDSLDKMEVSPIDGILGADIFLEKKAIIDYDDLCLYLTKT